ncbi:MAG: tetratricopeptide repeat protein [Alphaproteobacteria bacterium]|nr:tetratricopeptide repeat protein [Alphaproteobacteria bacterium]
MVDSNDSFLREIKQELDRERMENIWKRYGTLIVGAGALVVIAVAGFQIWNTMQTRAAQEAGASYEQALDAVFEKKLDEAAVKFSEIAKSGPTGYATLAEMQYAATLKEQGKPQEAVAEFEKVSKRDGADELIGGFAALQAAALRVGEADFKEMQNRLEPFIKDGEPWRFNALELLAVAAIEAGQVDEAKAAFEKILAEPNVPPAMRQRANLRMLQLASGESAASSGAVTPQNAAGGEAEKDETAAGGDAAGAQAPPK